MKTITKNEMDQSLLERLKAFYIQPSNFFNYLLTKDPKEHLKKLTIKMSVYMLITGIVQYFSLNLFIGSTFYALFQTIFSVISIFFLFPMGIFLGIKIMDGEIHLNKFFQIYFMILLYLIPVMLFSLLMGILILVLTFFVFISTFYFVIQIIITLLSISISIYVLILILKSIALTNDFSLPRAFMTLVLGSIMYMAVFMLIIFTVAFPIFYINLVNVSAFAPSQSELNEKLLNAVEIGDLDEVKKLIEKGADVNQDVSYNYNLLTEATADDNYEIAKILIDHGVNVNYQWGVDATALCFALNNKNKELARYLVTNGANVDARCRFGTDTYTPIQIATLEKDSEMLNFLMNNDGDTDYSLDQDNSILQTAVEEGSVEVLETLTSRGLDIKQKNKFGETLLFFARYQNVIYFLVEKGLDINAQDNYGNTPLLQAGENKDKIAFNHLLIVEESNVNIKNQAGITALMYASLYFSDDYIFIKLIEKGAKINVQDNMGRTPLHFAVQRNNLFATEFLIKNGADLNIKNNKNNTALDDALMYGNENIAKLLQVKNE